MNPTHVDGYQTAGSYVRMVTYDADIEQFDELIARAGYCEQSIRYRCYGSKLLSDPGTRFLDPAGSCQQALIVLVVLQSSKLPYCP